MAKETLRDLVVVLPGIMGSVLQVNGEDVWAPSAGAVWRSLSSLGAAADRLIVGNDDPDLDDLGDGVRATALMPRVVVPGLPKVDGYSRLLSLIEDNFTAVRGSVESDEPANLFAFPYDWRRDNRVAARKLKSFIERSLPRWRARSPQAKVILIAHSMGGLVARYYLEVLGGWATCKALIAFGTPFRGSVDALAYIANGYKQMCLDLTAVLRTCTSIYQLLPIYEVLQVDGKYRRVAEARGIPNLDPSEAEAGLRFHREIEDAVDRNRNDEKYRNSYKTLPIVGAMQPTLQSALLFASGELRVSRDLPDVVDEHLDSGDGTVPRVSATPIELSDEFRETFHSERHAALPANLRILNDLWFRLRQLQAVGAGAVRGFEATRPRDEQPSVGFELDDAFAAGEPVALSATVHQAGEDTSLEAELTRLDGRERPLGSFPLAEDGMAWKLVLEDLPAGQYRIAVQGRSGDRTIVPVHDLFEVIA